MRIAFTFLIWMGMFVLFTLLLDNAVSKYKGRKLADHAAAAGMLFMFLLTILALGLGTFHISFS